MFLPTLLCLNACTKWTAPILKTKWHHLFICVLGITVILNIIAALKIENEISATEDIQKKFVIATMALAIILMTYLFKNVYRTATFPRDSRGTLLRIFYDGGLYIFGFGTFGFSVSVVIDYVQCGQS